MSRAATATATATATTPAPAPAPATSDSPRDDEQPLRAAAVAGDLAAFGALYAQCRDTVYRYLMRRSNGDPHLAEDLTHETFVRALARIGSYREMGRPFVAWLVTIAGNLIADYYKSGWRRLQVPHSDFTGEVDEGVNRLVWSENRDDLATEVVEEEYWRYVGSVLGQAMSELTSWQRRVLQLRYVEGLSVRDTAIKLQVEEGAVKAATYRAVRVLARNPAVQRLRGETLPWGRLVGSAYAAA
jgi:RNA polymerase sigma-70 factor, ECF subfamily